MSKETALAYGMAIEERDQLWCLVMIRTLPIDLMAKVLNEMKRLKDLNMTVDEIINKKEE